MKFSRITNLKSYRYEQHQKANRSDEKNETGNQGGFRLLGYGGVARAELRS